MKLYDINGNVLRRRPYSWQWGWEREDVAVFMKSPDWDRVLTVVRYHHQRRAPWQPSANGDKRLRGVHSGVIEAAWLACCLPDLT
jgi:hypothetical protein